MSHRENVINKRGFSMKEYLEFARDVGKRIDFNRRMKKLAAYYDISIYHLGSKVDERFMDITRYGQHVPEDPIDCLLLYVELLDNAYEDLSINGIIAREIRPTPIKSFYRYGDRNCLTSSIKKYYIHEGDGTPLDTQAQNMSITYQKEITPDDLVQFILQNERGANSYQSEHELRLQELSDHYYSVTGSRLNPEFGALFCKEFLTYEQKSGILKAPF